MSLDCCLKKLLVLTVHQDNNKNKNYLQNQITKDFSLYKSRWIYYDWPKFIGKTAAKRTHQNQASDIELVNDQYLI